MVSPSRGKCNALPFPLEPLITFRIPTEDIDDFIGIEVAECQWNTIVDLIVFVIAEIPIEDALFIAEHIGRFFHQIALPFDQRRRREQQKKNDHQAL